MKEKYLSIGSVVTLKGGRKKIMIIGYCTTSGNSKEVYDYVGCIYPEGSLDSNQACLFNHEQIKSIDFFGFEDEEGIKFKNKLKNVVKQINNRMKKDN